ncbi:hypothetical protein MU852_08975 [Brevundimonas albigilva]|uniref:hypothetical protein n=1 Tax=Brevundimonas albigilva TaxID=1312364 RepID=UPI00201B8529|nr:hypothetical protein [Brevundimonas albigilva]UQV17119.1 hypothetical protein MU852_08975 [Brevundimonas albigilva]
MRALGRAACAAALVVGMAGSASAQDWLRVEGTRIVDEAGEPVILRGMGLGGWLLQEGYAAAGRPGAAACHP